MFIFRWLSPQFYLISNNVYFYSKIVHPFSLHATSRETRTLVTRARLKSFRPPSCARAYHVLNSASCPSFVLSRSCVHKMASSSPTKSAASSPYKDVHGYIHSVSEIQIPANPKSARYFDFTIQENQEDTRVICFTAEKKRWAETKGGSQTSYFPHKHQPTKKKIWRRCRIQDEQVLQNRTG